MGNNSVPKFIFHLSRFPGYRGVRFRQVLLYQKGVYYSQIKIFSHLPQNIKNLSWNVKKFKLALKRFLLMDSFYSLDEYFDWNSRSDLSTFT